MNIGIAQWCLGQGGIGSIWQAHGEGFESIHLDVGTPDSEWWLGKPESRLAYMAASEQTGVKLAAIAANSLCDNGLVHSFYTDAGQRSWMAVKTSIDAAADMNISVVTLPSFDDGEIRTKQDFVQTLHNLERACRYASDHSIVIASESNLGTEQLLILLRSLRDLYILFDSLNPMIFGHDPTSMWHELCERAHSVVHLKDGIDFQMGNVLLGQGVAPLSALVEAIKRWGHVTDVIIETEYVLLEGDQHQFMQGDIMTVKALWDST